MPHAASASTSGTSHHKTSRASKRYETIPQPSSSTRVHILTVAALLHLANSLRGRSNPRETLHPPPLPARLPEPEIPPRHQDLHSLDGRAHHRLRLRRRISVRARPIDLGPLDPRDVHELAGVCV